MNKLLRGGGYKILSKTIKIWRFEQNRKNGTEASSVRAKSKIVENQEKMFLVKILTKINFLERFLFFRSHPSLQNMKNMAANSMAIPRTSKTQKHIYHFYVFSGPWWTIWPRQSIALHLSCSELFFRLHCVHFTAPNDHICFQNFVPLPRPTHTITILNFAPIRN